MPKITKEQEQYFLPKSDWELDYWTKNLYDKHASEFKIWIDEYHRLREAYGDDTRMARWRWLEIKGGVCMKYDSKRSISPAAILEKYPTVSAMFDRMMEWVSFKEKMTLTTELRKEEIK